MPRVSWRWNAPEYSTLYSRLRCGSGLRDCRMPNELLLLGPISLSRAMSSPFTSFQVRLSVARNIGLYALTLSVANWLTYLLTLPFTAVLPSPNRSYDTPRRGERSLYDGTCTSSKCRAGTKRPTPASCARMYASKYSHRSP